MNKGERAWVIVESMNNILEAHKLYAQKPYDLNQLQ